MSELRTISERTAFLDAWRITPAQGMELIEVENWAIDDPERAALYILWLEVALGHDHD